MNIWLVGHHEPGEAPSVPPLRCDSFSDARNLLIDLLIELNAVQSAGFPEHDCDGTPCSVYGSACPLQQSWQYTTEIEELNELDEDESGMYATAPIAGTVWWISRVTYEGDDDDPLTGLTCGRCRQVHPGLERCPARLLDTIVID